MKLDNSVKKSILRLKQPDNQRVTSNLRQAAEEVSRLLAYLAQGAGELPGGYRAQILHSNDGLELYLVKGWATERAAIIAEPKPLWDSIGAVPAMETEGLREFTKEVSQGLVEAIGEHLGKVLSGRLKDLAALMGRPEEKGSPLRRATDWSGAENHA